MLNDAIEAGGSSLRDHRQADRRRSAISSTVSASMTARASPARRRAAGARSSASCRPAAPPSIVRAARNSVNAASDRLWTPTTNHHRRDQSGGGVGIITLNRPKALNALNRALLAELNAGARRLRGRSAPSGASCITGSEQRLRRRRRHQGDAAHDFPRRLYHPRLRRASWSGSSRARKPDHRGGGRLCARRRLRTGDDVRHRHRRRQGASSASRRSRSASCPAPAARSA